MSSVLLNEAAETDAWLESYLRADVALAGLVNGVFSTFIGTTSTKLPVVRFFLIEQDDLMVVNAERVWSELVYQVEAVTSGPETTEARSIARRLDALLHRLQGQSSATVYVQEVWRRSPLFRKEVESVDPYCYAGGEYVCRVSALA
jgi:hypothetical protein